jgi:hypothetical protein
LACWRVTGLVLGHAPGKQLTAEVAGLEQDSISAIKLLAAQPPDAAAKDEVAILRNSFIELARNHPPVGSAGRQRSPAPGIYRQYFARSAHAADLAAGLSGNADAEIRHADAEEHQQYLTIALRQGKKSAIFRSSCLSWRAWSTAALSRSASVSRWGADFRRGAEV